MAMEMEMEMEFASMDMTTDITMEQATRMMLRTQNMYLRGELPDYMLEDVLSVHPGAARDWDMMKCNMKVKRKKLLKKARNVVCTAHVKSRSNKRRRSGQLAKETFKLVKIKRQFREAGLNVFETWAEFLKEVNRKAGWNVCKM
jgi:hypothetical protein